MKVLIADDHAIIRQGLRMEIASIDAQATIEEAENQEQVLETVATVPDFDLILLDLSMPGPEGSDLVPMLCNQLTDTSVIVISALEDPVVITKTIEQGAAGYIPKSMATEVISSAIKLVLAGGTFLPKQMLNPNQAGAATTPDTAEPPVAKGLTSRQQQVLELLCLGASNQYIADELGITMNTVKTHVQGILKALGADNRTSAVVAASQMGLCSNH